MRLFQADFRILAVYVYKLDTPTSLMALEWEQWRTFRTKTKRSLDCLKLVIVQTQRKKCLAIFCELLLAATGPCHDSYMAEFFIPYLRKYSIVEATKQIIV